MAGIGISGLPMPPASHRCDRLGLNAKGKPRFETIETVLQEDQKRALRLRNVARRYPELFDRKRADDLASRLEESVGSDWYPHSTACRQYMRDLRRRAIGGLWQQSDPDAMQHSHKVAMVTIWSPDWVVPALRLVRRHGVDPFTPDMVFGNLRNHLNRVLPGNPTGTAFCGLHAYFDEYHGAFGFHVHAIVSVEGDLLERFATLRERWPQKYSTRDGGEGSVKVTVGLDNLPDPLSYCLQAFPNWLYYRDGKTGERCKYTRRMPVLAPYDSLYFLWIDQFRPEHLVLLMGLRPTRSGFRISKQS